MALGTLTPSCSFLFILYIPSKTPDLNFYERSLTSAMENAEFFTPELIALDCNMVLLFITVIFRTVNTR